MPRYVIHIGPHKTGTTYLQHAFTRLRPELAARGILYPQKWGSGEHGHHDLPAALAQPGDTALPEAFDALNRSGVDTVLLSSETFSYSSDADVRRLQSLVANERVEVVFYCRRWSELIPSGWREAVKHGSLDTMPEYILECLGDPTASPMVNFAQVLDRYATVFGSDSIRIVSYNSVLEAGEDLLNHFCRSFLAWPDPPPTGFGRVNPSLDIVDSEIIRTLNSMEWTRARDARERLFRPFLAAKDALPIRSIVEKSMQFVVNRVRIDDASPALADLHAAIAQRYRSALVPPFPMEGLFVPHVVDVTYVRSDYLLAEGIMKMVQAIQAKLLQSQQT